MISLAIFEILTFNIYLEYVGQDHGVHFCNAVVRWHISAYINVIFTFLFSLMNTQTDRQTDTDMDNRSFALNTIKTDNRDGYQAKNAIQILLFVIKNKQQNAVKF